MYNYALVYATIRDEQHLLLKHSVCNKDDENPLIGKQLNLVNLDNLIHVTVVKMAMLCESVWCLLTNICLIVVDNVNRPAFV